MAEFKTPQNIKKYLGVRRASSCLANLGGCSKEKDNNFGKASTSLSALTPQPSTPLTAGLEGRASSTNCRPYRLSLSKKIRDKMTKKRLFHVAHEGDNERCDESLTNTASLPSSEIETVSPPRNSENMDSDLTKELESSDGNGNLCDISISSSEGDSSIQSMNTKQISRAELIATIKDKQKELKAREAHEKRVVELQAVIEMWRNGYAESLDELEQTVKPHVEKSVLLQHLQIPQEMLKYAND